MDISEIRVKLVGNPKERLKAVCSVTFNGEFVVRDLKVIEGTSGLFVAMPSRKLADHCPKCRSKNHLRARFCNDCGQKLDEKRADRIRGGRARLHADIAHPINSDCRNHLQAQVVQAFEEELERSKQPGYQPAAYDELEVETGHEYDELIADLKKDAHGRRGARTRSDEPVDAEPAELPDAPEADDVPAARPAPAAPPAKDDDFSAGIV